MAGNKNKCHACAQKVNQRGIQCNICDRWFHPECEGLNESDYQLFKRSSIQVHIYCKACEVGASSLHKKIIALANSQKELEAKVDTLEDKVNSLPGKEEVKQIIDEVLDDKIEESIDSKMTGLTNKDETQEGNMCSQVIAEVKERETRQNNVIIHGIQESEEPEGAKRSEEDQTQVLKLLEEIGAKPPDEENITIKRLGKKTEDKKRPIMIKCKDAETKKKIITNAKKLKASEEFSQIGISHDLTKNQREELKNLQKKAREKTTDTQTYILVGDPGNWRIVLKKDKEKPEEGT